MTKVRQRKLSYGEELEKIRITTRFSKIKGTKNFATYHIQEVSKKSKHGAVKISKPPKLLPPYKEEFARDMNHLRSIMHEG